MATKLYQNDIGTIFTIDCGSDISGAINTRLLIRKPDGTLVEWTAVTYDSNYLRYTTVAGDLDQVGSYKLQATLNINNWSGRGETTSFTVYSSFR